MIRVHPVRLALTGIVFTALSFAALTPAAACDQWLVSPQFTIAPWNGSTVTFQLKQDGQRIYGYATYRTTQRTVTGNFSGSIVNDIFHIRVLWTYSGVSSIGQYTGVIRPPGYVFEGTTYDEYARPPSIAYWNGRPFTCQAAPPPSPANPPVKSLGRVASSAPPGPPRPICDVARDARARNSPAAPGLEAQCAAFLRTRVVESPGRIAFPTSPPAAAPISPAAPIGVQALDELAARGDTLATTDPLAAELRVRLPEGSARRGFEIGLAAAEGQTAPGPGKQRIHDSLGTDEQPGFEIAVAFSLERNRNVDLAGRGASIAGADASVAEARSVDTDVFYWLGFDIATGIFGDPALGALGNTAVGPGSLAIRNALSAAAQRGFDAAVTLHLGRKYR